MAGPLDLLIPPGLIIRAADDLHRMVAIAERALDRRVDQMLEMGARIEGQAESVLGLGERISGQAEGIRGWANGSVTMVTPLEGAVGPGRAVDRLPGGGRRAAARRGDAEGSEPGA